MIEFALQVYEGSVHASRKGLDHNLVCERQQLTRLLALSAFSIASSM